MADDNATTAAGRRPMLKCLAWAGAGVVWTVAGGVPRSRLIGTAEAATAPGGFSFLQISDSHIGFSHAPNLDPAATLSDAVAQLHAQASGAAFLIHTGDVSQASKPAQFDTADQIIRGANLPTHYVPGEHDVQGDAGAAFYARFTPGAPSGWYAFDAGGIHFIGLNNVRNAKPGQLGHLGADQLAWLAADLRQRPSSQPIVIFAHIPLWTVSADWGWGTDDAAQALALTKRFGSVTVLNGHVHQVMQKVEGHVSFHTARSTAFPQPAPGTAPAPGPMTQVPATQLKSLLGITRVTERRRPTRLAILDTTLDA